MRTAIHSLEQSQRHAPFQNSARIYVDADFRGITYLHVGQLSFAEVGLNPSGLRNEGQNLRARRK